MYSRPPSRQPSQKPIRLPEHYSGCAFSPSGERIPQERPPIPAPFFASEDRPPVDAEKKHGNREKEDHPQRPPFPDVFRGILGRFGTSLPFSGGLSFDELLLIGLILLLSRSEQESDIVLLLVLLLFCG